MRASKFVGHRKNSVYRKFIAFNAYIRKEERSLVQDGGVEGHALTPSCKNTGITTNC